MSSRRTLNKSEGSTNPATKFLEWKSNQKSFSYYDKDKGENVKVELPLKIQFLEHFHTVKGWNDASESGIYSNEVKFISKEPLKVKAFKGGEIAEGLYKDIRLKIIDAGGKYYKSIYCLLNGDIVNLQIKGAVVSAYTDFMSEHENQVEGNWITIESVKDHKKGATEYSTPNFEIGKAFTKAENALANDKYQDIIDYFDAYTKPQEEEEEEETIDDLAF
jgi:hypothetical protein